jgi:hypothetical protein
VNLYSGRTVYAPRLTRVTVQVRDRVRGAAHELGSWDALKRKKEGGGGAARPIPVEKGKQPRPVVSL